MKNLVKIGGAIALLFVLFGKKETITVTPNIPIGGENPDIFVPEMPVLPAETSKTVNQLNNQISPDLTDYETSDFDKLLNQFVAAGSGKNGGMGLPGPIN